MKGGQEYGRGSYVSCFFQVPHGSWGQVPRSWPLEEARAALEGPLHPTANGGSAALGRHRLAHLPVAQQDYPHQDDIDVGPQGLVMIDFVDLKDNGGGGCQQELQAQGPPAADEGGPRGGPADSPTPCRALHKTASTVPLLRSFVSTEFPHVCKGTVLVKTV